MKLIHSLLAAAALSTFAGAAFAGNSSGTPAGVLAAQNGIVIFSAGTKAGGPVCASIPNDWAVNTTTPDGKAIYALLLTAISTGRNVAVTGTNNCDAWGDRETAAQLLLL